MVEAPLELESRRRLYERIATTPGLHMRDLARRVEMDVRTALYHLRQLEKHGLVTALDEAGFRRYFPRTANGRGGEIVDVRDKPLLGLLRRRVPLYVALFLLAREGAANGEIAAGSGVSPSTLSYHLGRMERAGMLARDGLRYRLADPDRVARLLYAHRPTEDLVEAFLDLWEDFTLRA